MRYLVTGKEMSLYDKQTSEHFHVPSVILMEQAAHAFVERMLQRMSEGGLLKLSDCDSFRKLNSCDTDKSVSTTSSLQVLVVCGTGNNGGDGIAIARLLNQSGIHAEIYAPTEGHRTSELFDLQYQIYQSYGYPVCDGLVSSRHEKFDEVKSNHSLSDSVFLKEGYVSDFAVHAVAGENQTIYQVVIDAIFGTGLERPVTGMWADVIAAMNAMPGYKLAVDIASGVSADTGEILGTAFRADETITFSFTKLGQCLWPGAAYSGKVTVVPIGITEESFLDTVPRVRAYEDSDLCRLPSRKPNSHKGSYGKLLVIAGSAQMAGAAVFAAKAAYRMGTGLVKVMTPESNRVILQTQVPEAILSTYPDDECRRNIAQRLYANSNMHTKQDAPDTLGDIIQNQDSADTSYGAVREWKDALHQQVRRELSWADALVIGPGIGTGEAATEILRCVLEEGEIPMVLDADALNIISREGWQALLGQKEATEDETAAATDETAAAEEKAAVEAKNIVEKTSAKIAEGAEAEIIEEAEPAEAKTAVKEMQLMRKMKGRNSRIITPHMGEMSRLTGSPVGNLKAHICEEAAAFSAEHQVVCVLKDARTVTAVPDGSLYLNLSGNNGMATAGSGDVLSGILGGLLVQGLDPQEAAPLGVYFHGKAGDSARDRLGARAMMASDMIEGITAVSVES